MKVELYEDSRGEWRWRMKARNGRNIATGGEGFSSKRACEDSVKRVIDQCRNDLYPSFVVVSDGEEAA